MDPRPVGIFDSGVGGLTVVREVRKILGTEDIVYFGDTARVPYGNKSRDTIIRFAKEDIDFLLSKDVKIIIAACNTVSSIAIDELKHQCDVTIIGVLGPGAKEAIKVTKNNRVGVIGTNATISSGAYSEHIKKLNEKTKVFTQACPLFVPLVEEGWENTEIALMTAKIYLSHLAASDIDTLVLGCTHYPLLKNTIKQVMGRNVTLVDSAQEVSKVLAETLRSENILNRAEKPGTVGYYLSDIPPNFIGIAERFLGEKIDYLERINV
ncbi:glutamate racemase [candidate division WOR-3 bacterium]|nr:glutamate racemase [candidate division WOR-3 bacterium]